ncbi:hypothetical protein IFM89_028423 [Coptis chinensis]|uniref:WRKY domain-containing protein n=1 Tax=Coptis chinensis TaxID=261450 RepID=A0A835M784_9MAGN|nr:hypothetical protein IFM89_028423 [Coptis chinensis]
MDGRFNNSFVSEHEDPRFMIDISDSSQFSGITRDDKLTPTPSPKRSRRAIQKRVVSVPIGDVDASRLKGEGAPPSDSWAWRKYGQKPIKGSPFPRGYYRCSSSKGCPARKQVERSRLNPTMLLITYACDHNHPSKTTNSNSTPTTTTTTSEPDESPAQESNILLIQPKPEPETQFSDLVEGPLMTSDDFSWFAGVASTSPTTVFDSPIYAGNSNVDDDVEIIFPIVKEEDESLFADLGELPECSVVFRRGFIEKEGEHRRCNLRASWCESTG